MAQPDPSNCICQSAPLVWLQALRGKSVLFTASQARKIVGDTEPGCLRCAPGVDSKANRSAPRRANVRGHGHREDDSQ